MPHYLIVISGRAGSGKSSIANEMAAQLRRRGTPHANVDGDNLDAVYPEPTDDGVMLANLEGMWRTYRGIGGCGGDGGGGRGGEAAQVDRLIVSGTAIVSSFERIVGMMERVAAGSGSASDISTSSSSSSSPALMATATATEEEEETGDSQHHHRNVSATAIILTASDDTAAQRLRGREVGSELDACLASSGRMGRVLEEEVGDWAERVATDGVEVGDSAMRVLRVAGWV